MLKPPTRIEVSKEIVLQKPTVKDAAAHLALTERNRERFKPWLPWAHFMHTEVQFQEFLKTRLTAWRLGEDFSYKIMWLGEMIGRASFVRMDHRNGKGEIGYWIDAAYEGKGIVTQVVQKLIEVGFTDLDFERIEIRCAVGNERSAAVPQRLGFDLECIARHAERMADGGFRDLRVFVKTRT